MRRRPRTRSQRLLYRHDCSVRSPSDVVLDPSAGEGAFILAAAQRLTALGATSASQLIGIELSSSTVRRSQAVLLDASVSAKMICRDFFKCSVRDTGQVDALIGNPPFIRLHRFSGDTRERAISRACDDVYCTQRPDGSCRAGRVGACRLRATPPETLLRFLRARALAGLQKEALSRSLGRYCPRLGRGQRPSV